jgi:hypothetical protein
MKVRVLGGDSVYFGGGYHHSVGMYGLHLAVASAQKMEMPLKH